MNSAPPVAGDSAEAAGDEVAVRTPVAEPVVWRTSSDDGVVVDPLVARVGQCHSPGRAAPAPMAVPLGGVVEVEHVVVVAVLVRVGQCHSPGPAASTPVAVPMGERVD